MDNKNKIMVEIKLDGDSYSDLCDSFIELCESTSDMSWTESSKERMLNAIKNTRIASAKETEIDFLIKQSKYINQERLKKAKTTELLNEIIRRSGFSSCPSTVKFHSEHFCCDIKISDDETATIYLSKRSKEILDKI